VKVSANKVAITDVLLDAFNGEYIYPIYITNTGNIELSIENITYDNHKSSFINNILDYTSSKTIPVDSTVKIEVVLAESTSPQQLNTLKIVFSNATKYEIDFTRTEYNSVDELKKEIYTYYKDNFLYVFGLEPNTFSEFEIYDIFGRILEKGILLENISRIEFKKNLSTSIYFLKLVSENGIGIIPFQIIN
jgi:hypothetical protein